MCTAAYFPLANPPFSGGTITVVLMASQTRTASSRQNGAKPRTAASGSTRQAGPSTRRGATRSSGKRPSGSRNQSKGHKQPRNHKKGLWWKILLGVIGGLLLAGIGLFIYLYATTDIPQPEKVAIAEKTNIYYSDGTTPIGSISSQNREIIDCSVLPE